MRSLAGKCKENTHSFYIVRVSRPSEGKSISGRECILPKFESMVVQKGYQIDGDHKSKIQLFLSVFFLSSITTTQTYHIIFSQNWFFLIKQSFAFCNSLYFFFSRCVHKYLLFVSVRRWNSRFNVDKCVETILKIETFDKMRLNGN